MKNVNDIYCALRDLGICENQNSFSTKWLGRSEGYFAYIQSTGAAASPAALGMLCTVIASNIQQYADGDNTEDRRKLFVCMVTAWTLLNRQMRAPQASKAPDIADPAPVSVTEPLITAPRRWTRGIGYRP